MQTEFPRNETLPPQGTDDRGCAAAAYATSVPGPTEDDLELIDMRYEQFIAQSELEDLMYEL